MRQELWPQFFRGRGPGAFAQALLTVARPSRGGRLMPQAIVDPQELRRFAMQLRQFNNDMLNQMTVLHGQLNNLGQTWRDKENEKFVEQFEQTLTAVSRFVDATNQHVPFLLRKADRVEEYLQQR
jgi:uncharacterized protein YukE